MSNIHHSWDLSPTEAISLQKQLAPRIIREARLGQVKTVAGIDASYRDGLAQAAVVVLSYPTLETIESATARLPVNFPYIPGLLSFREAPAVLEAIAKLAQLPDLLIFDSQGLAHPRRFGLACHVGLWLDLPAIGCAKTRLSGQYTEPDPSAGSFAWLIDQGETIGAVLRTRPNVKPVFVSIGHRVDLPASIHYVLTCCRSYRLPEPTRLAHRLAAL